MPNISKPTATTPPAPIGPGGKGPQPGGATVAAKMRARNQAAIQPVTNKQSARAVAPARRQVPVRALKPGSTAAKQRPGQVELPAPVRPKTDVQGSRDPWKTGW